MPSLPFSPLPSRAKHAPALCAALAVLSARAAHAQGNYSSTPIGGRSALLGGTGIALGRDGSVPFLNPGRIADVAGNSLAFSVNFYSFENAHFENFNQPSAVDRQVFGQGQLPATSLNQSRLDALPSTLCLFLTLSSLTQAIDHADGYDKGRQKLGICIGNLERQNLEVNSAHYTGSLAGLQSNQSISFNHAWNRLYIGPTFGMYVTDALTLGGSIYGVYTTYDSVVAADNFSVVSGRAITSSYDASGNGTSFDLGTTLGATYHLDRVYTVGVAATTPTLHVAGSYSAALATQFAGAGSAATLATGTGSFVANAPIRIGVGIGAELPRFKVEADVSYYFARSNAVESDLTVTEHATSGGGAPTSRSYAATYKDGAEPIANSALGLEWLMNESLSMLLGVSTDFSAVPLLSSSSPPGLGNVTTSRVSRAGGSFGIASRAGGSELIFGTQISYGWGRTFVPNEYVLPNRLGLTEESLVSVLLVVGGTTSLDAFKQAAIDIGNMVKKAVTPK